MAKKKEKVVNLVNAMIATRGQETPQGGAQREAAGPSFPS
jgi:hypothetical protein